VIKRKRRWPLVALLLSACMLTPALGVTSSSSAAVSAVRASTTTPSIATQLFADQVETLGASKYPDSFAGATLMPTGETVVYTRLASDAALVKAINAINKSGYPVTIVGVSRSYNQLNALSAALNAADKHLLKMGIRLTQSWPDPASGSVKVNVATPQKSDVAALASGIKAAVTASTYRSAVSAQMQSQFGAGVQLNAVQGGTWVAAGRNNDTAPFYDGDQITGGGYLCTGGFNMVGNASGRIYMFTAGHCPSATYSTQAATVGKTSTNYLGACNTSYDFQSIYVPGGGLDDVWGAGGSLYTVIGKLLPAAGTLMTFDGSVTGEVRGNVIDAINTTDYNVYDSVAECIYNAWPVVQATNPNGTWVCQPGDSGGPAIVHTPTATQVNAVGTIVAYYSVDGRPGGATCSAEQIGKIESVTNTTLLTG
jgi:starvation-inducible outer membrane lipoprotein